MLEVDEKSDMMDKIRLKWT